MASAGTMNKAQFFKTVAVAKAISSAVNEKIQDYPNGALLKIREMLDTTLPATVQSVHCSVGVAELRQMIDVAEGYESFVRFPEKTVRYAIEHAIKQLEKPLHTEVENIKKLVLADVKASFDNCRAELVRKVENERAAEDLEAYVFSHCDSILSAWHAKASNMVEQLVAMEHEMPDIKMLRGLFRENGRKELEMTQEAPTAAAPPESPDSRRFIMGHLDKKNEKTGVWAMRWCVVQPKTQQLFVHKDASKDPLYAVDMSKMQMIEPIVLKKKDKGGAATQNKSRVFLLKPLNPSESTVPHKHRATLRFRAPSHQVKELWVRALEPLCGRPIEKSMGKIGFEPPTEAPNSETRQTEREEANPPTLDASEEESSDANGTFYHSMDVEENIEVFSKALAQYFDHVKAQLLVSIPKAVVHLFVEKVQDGFAEALTDRLVESL